MILLVKLKQKLDYLYINIYVLYTYNKQMNTMTEQQQALIIVVGKITYGYNNEDIDFICFADNKQSEISIKQICGRGLRWNHMQYPNKILHILIFYYGNDKYEHLRKYLQYIISECDQQYILQNKQIQQQMNRQYSNNIREDKIQQLFDDIPIQLCIDLCTTGALQFSRFMIFLKSNNIFDEQRYNIIQQKHEWMNSLERIFEKYPKFSFKQIHPQQHQYYQTYQEAIHSYNNIIDVMYEQLNMISLKKQFTQSKMMQLICQQDEKIPYMNLLYYYGQLNH